MSRCHVATGEGTAVPARQLLKDEETMSFGEYIRQFVCGLSGHDELMKFEKERLTLQCINCGHESPGWLLDWNTPTTMTTKSTLGPTEPAPEGRNA